MSKTHRRAYWLELGWPEALPSSAPISDPKIIHWSSLKFELVSGRIRWLMKRTSEKYRREKKTDCNSKIEVESNFSLRYNTEFGNHYFSRRSRKAQTGNHFEQLSLVDWMETGWKIFLQKIIKSTLVGGKSSSWSDGEEMT